MSALQVTCSARRDYVPHSAAMLHSLLTEGGDLAVHVHYLHGADLPPGDLGRLRSMVEGLGGAISFIEVTDGRLGGLATNQFFPASHWYRIFLPELLPELDKVLYLDADTIILDSLAPLWETDLAGNCLAAVTNVFQDDHLPRLPKLGFDDPGAYFNSGVMLLNLAEMRSQGATEAIIDWAVAHHDEIDLPEQDALNAVLGGRRVHLHPRWNLMNSILTFPWAAHVFGFKAIEEARHSPAIRHFEGPFQNKPWHYLCDFEMRDLYLAHRRQTPWPDFEPEGRTATNVARKSLRRARARNVGRR